MLRKSLSAVGAVLAGAGILGAAPVGAVAAPSLTINATDDAYTSSARKDASIGAEEKLAVGKLGTDVKVAFLKFVVPAGSSVTFRASRTLARTSSQFGGVTGSSAVAAPAGFAAGGHVPQNVATARIRPDSA